eukprot:gene6819-30791_t
MEAISSAVLHPGASRASSYPLPNPLGMDENSAQLENINTSSGALPYLQGSVASVANGVPAANGLPGSPMSRIRSTIWSGNTNATARHSSTNAMGSSSTAKPAAQVIPATNINRGAASDVKNEDVMKAVLLLQELLALTNDSRKTQVPKVMAQVWATGWHARGPFLTIINPQVTYFPHT